MSQTKTALLWMALLLAPVGLEAQAVRRAPGSAELKHRIEKLRTVGRVLMIAAHPDDENTAFLAYCAQGRKLRTAYLSLTRGEGGQNLIGSEQGALLGVIRTQELLAARRIDGAEQFFTRAIDFGFSKSAPESLEKWGHEAVLGDVVQVIREFRPDVIVNRFSGTPRDGHGHHQASALLGKEAFRAAADPARFPERGRPWQAKRLLWNGFSFSRAQEQELEQMAKGLRVDLGEFDALVGYSYGELAGISRSQHRSQGMGSAERRGSVANHLFVVDGAAAETDWLEGLDLSWARIPGGASVEEALARADREFDVNHPERVLGALVEARRRMAALQHEDARGRMAEVDEAIALAAGLWLDVSVNVGEAAPGETVRLTLTAVSRMAEGVTLERVAVTGMPGAPVLFDQPAGLARNKAVTASAQFRIPEGQAWTQPFWLARPAAGNLYTVPPEAIGWAEGAPALEAEFLIRVGGERIVLKRPVECRYVDRVRGEMTRPFAVAPAVAVRIPAHSLLFPDTKARPVTVEARALAGGAKAVLRLKTPAGWRVEPAEVAFEAKEKGEQKAIVFQVTPGATGGVLTVEGAHEVTRIEYEHIPVQTIQPPASARVVRADVQMTAKRIGYVMGAGDEVPAALRQMGAEVEILDAAALAHGELSRYQAIVTGVRAWNVREDLRSAHERLKEFARAGGTVVVQYNIQDGVFFGSEAGTLKNVGPLPVKISRDRVTVEEADVRVLKPDHVLLQGPNAITAADFEGWVQERGLYFPGEWDSGYDALLEMNDPGEEPLRSGLLAARTGRGWYVLTSLSFFRQLPAGVPGAYRLFANLVSGGVGP
ncbi:MAG: PIG-L family deacetylase [Bryobacteraceae bacterium]|nr:PIG-L family deacetylase [Solibacteraceae bacterium]MCO5353535.1 PIG-L family deacetylase [Bryobacteraceae bacterium]